MRKLSEVAKIVGVTRRTLQEYDKIGLLSPTTKTDSGYWMYDENSIKKLMAIQVFVEVGYERKKIKHLLETPNLDLIKEYDQVITMLEDKQKRIEGMINLINIYKLIAQLPESVLLALSNIQPSHVYNDKSFSAYLKEAISASASDTAADRAEKQIYFPFWFQLTAVGCLREMEPAHPEVQECVRELCNALIDMIINDDDTSEEDREECRKASEYEKACLLEEGLCEILEEPGVIDLFEQQCGQDAASFVQKAIREYKLAQDSTEQNCVTKHEED